MTSETNVIQGKIVEIIDEYTIVINKGTRDGVKNDMRFAIYHISPHEIKDPDTGEVLGKAELFKGYGRVFSVQEKLSILKSDKFETASMTSLIPTLASMLEPRKRLPFTSPEIGNLARTQANY